MLSSRRRLTATRAKVLAGELRGHALLLQCICRIPIYVARTTAGGVQRSFPKCLLERRTSATTRAFASPKTPHATGCRRMRKTRMRSAAAVASPNRPRTPPCRVKCPSTCMNTPIQAASSHVCGPNLSAAVLKTHSTLPPVGSEVFYGGMKWFC